MLEIVGNESARPWDRHEIEFCETLATQAAITLQRAQLFERVRFMADHDALTGLANTRVFHRKAAAAERAALRLGTPLGVLVMDVDAQAFEREGFAMSIGLAVAPGISAAVARDRSAELRETVGREHAEQVREHEDTVRINECTTWPSRPRRPRRHLGVTIRRLPPGHDV